MSSLPANPASVPVPARAGRLPTSVAFYVQASITVLLLAGSAALTPLYAVYQAKWGFSPITTTVIFGVYSLAVLTTLLTVGSLSDHIGRRPVLIATVLVQAATMVVFATATGVPALVVGRIMQGLSTGAALGAVGAGMLDLNRNRGTTANAVAPLTGLAVGGIGSGLLIQYLPAPTHLVFVVLGVIFIGQAVLVALMPESSAPVPGAVASLKPEFGLPRAARRPLLRAAPGLVAAWALMGLYGALGPSLVRLVTGSDSLALGGLALFVFGGSAALAVLLLRNAPSRRLLGMGTVALIVGVAITLLSTFDSSAAAFFIGTAVAGAGFGTGFQGAIRSVLPFAKPHERAGVLSVVYVLSYLALGLPTVIAGVLVVHGGGELRTAREYGVAVMVLAAVALLGLARRHHPQQPTPPPSTDPAGVEELISQKA